MHLLIIELIFLNKTYEMETLVIMINKNCK